MSRIKFIQILKGLFALAVPFSSMAQEMPSQERRPLNQEEVAEIQKAIDEFKFFRLSNQSQGSFSDYLKQSRGLDDKEIDRILSDKVSLKAIRDYAKKVQAEPFKS